MDQRTILVSASKEIECPDGDSLRLIGAQVSDSIFNDTYQCNYYQVNRDFGNNQQFNIPSSLAHSTTVLTRAHCVPKHPDAVTSTTYDNALEHQFTEAQLRTACQTGGKCVTNASDVVMRMVERNRQFYQQSVEDVLTDQDPTQMIYNSNDTDDGAMLEAFQLGHELHNQTLRDIVDGRTIVCSAHGNMMVVPLNKQVEIAAEARVEGQSVNRWFTLMSIATGAALVLSLSAIAIGVFTSERCARLVSRLRGQNRQPTQPSSDSGIVYNANQNRQSGVVSQNASPEAV